MANHSISILILLPLSILFISSSEACAIKIYPGQNGNGLSLKAACDTGYYKYVSVAFLIDFGCDQPPVLDLAETRTSLSNEVAYCQSKGIKVLLSLGGQHSLCWRAEAKKVAHYLWTTFLSGSGTGPLGPVALDGVDFDIEASTSNLYWEDLTKALSEYSTTERKIYLSAAPQCIFPDYYLDTAIRTGLFDYVWVQFYNNPSCDYRSGVSGLLKSWNQWSTYLAHFSSKTKLFMGLPASGAGYIEPNQLLGQILPVIQKTTNYGGLILSNRCNDCVPDQVYYCTYPGRSRSEWSVFCKVKTRSLVEVSTAKNSAEGIEAQTEVFMEEFSLNKDLSTENSKLIEIENDGDEKANEDENEEKDKYEDEDDDDYGND